MQTWPKDIQRLVTDKGDRSAQKRAWDLCVLFVSGNQWLTYDQSIQQYEVARAGRQNASKVTVNLLLNVYRNILSRLSVNYPSIAVIPATPDAEDSAKAKSMELLLEYYWNQSEMKDVITDMIKNLLVMGTSGLHTYYDPDREVVTTEQISAYDLFFEDGVRNPEESSFIAIRSYHTKHDLKIAYPDMVEQIEDAEEVSPQA